jgi:hypothetical protein
MKQRLLILFLVCIYCSTQAIHPPVKDSLLKVYKLKSNYQLAYRQHDSILFIAIEKGNSSIELAEGEEDTSMHIEALGYPYADFDSSFAIATHLGANPVKVAIYNKSSGGMLMYGGTPFYLDTVKGLLMYEGAYGKYGKLILFNAKKGKAEMFVAPNDNGCFGFGCWKVEGITDIEIKIEYLNAKQESVVKTYSRK